MRNSVKYIMSAIMGLSIFLSAPKAHAGLVIMLTAVLTRPEGGDSTPRAHKVRTATLGVAVLLYSVGLTTLNPWAFLLDADTDESSEEIGQTLIQTHSFLADQSEVVSELSDLIHQEMRLKAAEPRALGKLATLSIPETQVRQILASTNLTAAQVERLVQDLK